MSKNYNYPTKLDGESRAKIQGANDEMTNVEMTN